MNELLDWRWEKVEEAEGETPTYLHRLVLPDDEIECDEVELLRFHMNTVAYLKANYPDPSELSQSFVQALELSVATLSRWLNVAPEPTFDPRLEDRGVQMAMLEAWLGKYQRMTLTSDMAFNGAVELLQARSKVMQPIREAVQSTINDLNTYNPNVARHYHLAGEIAFDDRYLEQLNLEELEDSLQMELDSVMTNAENALAEVLTKWTRVMVQRVNRSFAPSVTMAEWIMEDLENQREADPENPVLFTKELSSTLVSAVRRFTHRALTSMCDHHGLGMLVVNGPQAGQVVDVDLQGKGRPLGLFPVFIEKARGRPE